jgi:hypothetical protein
LREELRGEEHIKRAAKTKLELVFKMALRYIRWAQRVAKFRGKYEECYPTLARGICETFYTDDDELAACFGVSPAQIEQWRAAYPDFRNQIQAGKSSFTRQGGSDVCRQRWFRLRFAAMARTICSEFEPTKRQLVRCFNVKAATWKDLNEWMNERCYGYVWTRLEEIQGGVFFQTVQNICMEFNPDDEQLARILGVDVNKVKGLRKWMELPNKCSDPLGHGQRIVSQEVGRWLLKASGFLYESPEVESENDVENGDTKG